MSMSNRSAETSVTFSLAELANLERERVDEEERARAREQARTAKARREEEDRRREAEAATRSAEEAERARRARDDAAERARAAARDESAREVAKIEAEARARLAADDAVRAHEIAVLRVRTEAGRRRVQIGLASALALVVTLGAAGVVRASGQSAGFERDVERLRDGQAALMRERDAAKAAEVASLDERFAHLRLRPLAGAASVREVRATAEAARAAIDAKAPEHARVRALADALDALEARLDAAQRLAALERRHEDLLAIAGERRGGDALAGAKSARSLAERSDDALPAYDRALDALRDELAKKPGRGVAHSDPASTPCVRCDPHDPLCGLDGCRLGG
jgi:hypothetical protein